MTQDGQSYDESRTLDEELWVLGALIADPECRDEVFESTQREYFQRAENLIVFDLVHQFYLESKSFDWGIVTNELRRCGQLGDVGGPDYIRVLMDSCPNVKNVRAYVERLREANLETKFREFQEQKLPEIHSGSDNIKEKLLKTQLELENINLAIPETSLAKARDVVWEAQEDMNISMRQDFAEIGVPTGIVRLDNVVRSFRPCEYILIGARPSMGKTTFACNIAANLVLNEFLNSKRKRTVAIFSIEMSRVQLMERMIAAEAVVPFTEMMEGRLVEVDWRRVVNVAGRFADSNLYIDADESDVHRIRAKARRLEKTEGLDLIIIDYFQMLTNSQVPASVSRQERYTETSRVIKEMAKECRVPVVALSQLSREVERRSDKKPMLSDLRDTGSLEQDADVVVFMFRPWVYDKKIDPSIAYMIVAKQRNGATAEVEAVFLGPQMRFINKP